MVEVPILRPQDKDSNKGIEKIRKGSVERPEGLDSAAATSTSVKRKVCGRDLGCEFGKGLLERGRRVRVSLRLRSVRYWEQGIDRVLTFQSHDMLARLIDAGNGWSYFTCAWVSGHREVIVLGTANDIVRCDKRK